MKIRVDSEGTATVTGPEGHRLVGRLEADALAVESAEVALRNGLATEVRVPVEFVAREVE